MTLIIGCITSEFAVLAGDTQLTVGDLQRGTDLKREVEIKVSQYSDRFMMGILGQWSWFYPLKEGKATYINNYDLLKRRFKTIDDDKVGFLNKFLLSKSDIDATAIFINKTEDGFTMDSFSSQTNRYLSRMSIDEKNLIFNEPFYHFRGKMIEEKITEFSTANNIDNSLGDVLFLVNNTILDIIAKGKEIDVVTDNGVCDNVKNTIGGYVTIQVMVKKGYGFNCLYRSYNYDFNTLLDKTTYTFSSFVDRHPEIRYLDNLSMLIKANLCDRNDQFVRQELLKCIEKQLKYLSDLGIVKKYLLNEFIDLVNEKYDLGLDTIKVEKEAEEFLSLELFLGGNEENIDLDYIKRFI